MTDRTCSVDGCDRPVCGWDLCAPHYKRWKKTGDVRAEVPIGRRALIPVGTLCAIDGCGKSAKSRGWCVRHYTRWCRSGDPLKGTRIIRDVMDALERVDRSGGPDACHPWTGAQTGDGYGDIARLGVSYRAHVLAWESENGPRPPGIELDHECHNQALRDGTCRPGKCPHRLCCNPGHIVPRTRVEHIAASDRQAYRRTPLGVRGCSSKLTEAQVSEMRPLLREARGRQIEEIARQYGISRAEAYNIKSGRTWAWLPDAA